MREKLIELLENGVRCPADTECDRCPYHDEGYWDYCHEAPATADMLIANGVTIQRWIPVTERLPEDRVRVLCFGGANGYEFIKIARFTTCLEHFHEYDFEGRQRHGFLNYDSEYGYYEETDVTHWMQLPEPPKGE